MAWRSRGGSPPAARSRRRPPAAQGRAASRAGTRGSPASTAATGWRRANSASSRASRAASDDAGIGQHAGLVDDEQRPRAEAAVGDPGDPVVGHRAGQRHRREVVSASARAPDVDGAASGPSGAGSSMAVMSSPRRERRDPGPDEARRRSGWSGPRPARRRRPSPRRRAAPAACRPPATRCRCFRPASPGCGSGRTRRRRPPRRGPGSRAGRAGPR